MATSLIFRDFGAAREFRPSLGSWPHAFEKTLNLQIGHGSCSFNLKTSLCAMAAAPVTPDYPPRLVVFGCGYLGREVALEGVRRGIAVQALTRNPATAAALEAQGIRTIVADLATDAWHERVPGPYDFAVNCVSSGGGGVDGYQRSYVDGMKSVVAWAAKGAAPGTLVFTSSTSVYAQTHGGTVDEEARVGGTGDRRELLLQAESILQQNPAGVGRWFILRLAGLYGPQRVTLADQVRSGLVTGLRAQHLNLIHRDDACAAVWSALAAPEARANEVYNVADDGGTTRGEIAEWLAQQLGLPRPDFAAPAETAPKRSAADRIISAAKLRRQLGWAPRYPTFREGYARILSR